MYKRIIFNLLLITGCLCEFFDEKQERIIDAVVQKYNLDKNLIDRESVLVEYFFLDVYDVRFDYLGNTELQSCTYTVNEQDNEFTPVSSKCHPKELPFDCDEEKLPKIGGMVTKYNKDPKYKTLAEEALLKYTKEKSLTKTYKVGKIEKVTEQLVAGSLTRVHFIADAEDGEESMKCFAIILEQMWLNKKEVNATCDVLKKKNKRDDKIVGGELDQDINDEEYKKLAEESLAKHLENSKSNVPLKVQSIKKVTTQIVSGVMTRITFVVASDDGKIKGECLSKILEQEWLNRKGIDVSCEFKGKNDYQD